MQKPTSNQRKQAIITGVVLAVMALGIYGVVILQYITRP